MGKKKNIAFANEVNNDERLKLELSEYDYAVNDIVYIRGTKEGYEKIKPYINNFYKTKKSNITKNKNALIKRYINLKEKSLNIAPGELKKYLDGKTIEEWQEEWVERIQNALDSNGTISSKDVANSLSEMQKAITGLSQVSQLATAADTMIQQLDNLEKEYAKMSDDDKKLFLKMFNPENLEGQIVRIDNGLISFDRFRKNIEKIKNYTYISNQGIFKSINREAGYLNEIVDTWAIAKGLNLAELGFRKAEGGALKIISTGDLAPEQTNTTISSKAKPDSALTYSAKIGNNTLDFQVGISYKVSGALSDGKAWKEDGLEKKYIQIFDTSKAYPLLIKAFGHSALAHNSNLNTLVWENAGAENYKIISKTVSSKFLEQFIAGGGTKLKGTNIFDQADMLIVNGKAIPVVSILYKIMNEWENGWDKKSTSIIQNNFSFTTKDDKGRVKPQTKKSIIIGSKASDFSEKDLMNALKLTIKLNAKLLYDLAR